VCRGLLDGKNLNPRRRYGAIVVEDRDVYLDHHRVREGQIPLGVDPRELLADPEG